MANSSHAKGFFELRNESNMTSPQSNDFQRSRSFSFEGKHFTEKVIKLEWNASSMGMSRNGKKAVLAARRGFLLVDFDEPSKPKKVVCTNKWEPGPLEWNPHQNSENLFASVMNQKIDIWDFSELTNGNPKVVLSGHTRTISDINWNYYDPNQLLTCSMDTYINLWDVRQSKKPSSTFTTVAGSSQVRWNRKNRHIFASAHDGDVRMWDIRKGNIPFVYIACHLSKIHGLDWSPQKETYFVTASNDSTVKFWDMNSPKHTRASINNGAPVWKARYTPFGNGLVTVLVPQLRRSENSLFLWNRSEFKNPVHKFDGHTDVVLEFQWRTQTIDDQLEYQLVSLSKDQTLRLWKADKKTVQAITGEYDKTLSRSLETAHSPLSPTPSYEYAINSPNHNVSRDSFQSPPTLSSTMKELKFEIVDEKGNQLPRLERPNQLPMRSLALLDTKPYTPLTPTSPLTSPRAGTFPQDETLHGETLSPLSGRKTAFRQHQGSQPQSPSTGPYMGSQLQLQTLQQEFSLIKINNPVYKIDKMDPAYRVCSVSAKIGQHIMRLHISFPLFYPDKVAPNFSFDKDSKINIEIRRKITTALNEVSQQHVKFNRICLEPCLRQLAQLIEELKAHDASRNGDNLTPLTPTSNQSQSFPFKSADAGFDLDSTVPFPRTCGARFCGVGDRLVIFSRPEKYSNIVQAEKSFRSLSALIAYLEQLEKEEELDYGHREPGFYKRTKAVGLVYISDTSPLLPVSRVLAQNYCLNSDDPTELCLKNARLAKSVNRPDLVQTWHLLSEVLSKKLMPVSNIDQAFVPPWACHPFGKPLVDSLFQYYESVKDIQTLALMSCVLAKQFLPDEIRNYFQKLPEDENTLRRKPKYASPDGFQVSPEFPYNVYKLSSGDESWSPPTFIEEKRVDPQEEFRKKHSANCRLLDPEQTFRFDQFKRYYGEILYRWNLNSQRTEVMKYITEQPEQMRSVDICLECIVCRKPQRGPCCVTCKSIIIQCSVCRVGVRGLLSYCVVCGHGGHMFHLMDWFRQNDWCATGCGCCCLRIGKFSSE